VVFAWFSYHNILSSKDTQDRSSQGPEIFIPASEIGELNNLLGPWKDKGIASKLIRFES
jgi:hypothetical protein